MQKTETLVTPSDELYMRRALELATLGQGRVSPNPMVGCVIVHHNQIVGEGWHRKYGDWHAEVNAVNDVTDQSLLRESTVYVTLEPCSHHGKTPPCADLLVQHQVKRVVICNVDTNPLVGGQGIAKLREAGIAVQTGVMATEGRWLNRRFFTFIEQNRPYIILKWAETADGFIARKNQDSKWISSPLSRMLVHRWRAEETAIMVGTNTALHDNPQLNVRDWSGNNPLRIVVDLSLRLPGSLRLFDGRQPTICYNLLKNDQRNNLQFVQVQTRDTLLTEIIQDLYARKIQSLIVEGGSALLNSFIAQQWWDEIRLFKSPQTFGSGIAAPVFQGNLLNVNEVTGDRLFCYAPVSERVP